MNSEANDPEPTTPKPGEFPVADVVPAGTVKQLVGGSRMWWIALACLLGAITVSWFALPDKGTQVVIHFPEGHGLRAEDSVRHRGIDIGRVESVELNRELTGVDVTISLNSGAERLAREGTRFWVVRPQFSLTSVEALETAVGAKYIAVSPGDPNGDHRTEFDGLSIAPPNDLAADQTQIVLRGHKRHSLTAGSPLTWRGVDVGGVLSVHLAPDARYVDVIVGVDAEYQKLLREDSKFWVTSGVDLDVGLKGIRIDTESLATIARGGVSFISPTGTNAGPAASGQVFNLHDNAESEWLEQADAADLVDVNLPETVSVQATWKMKTFGIRRTKSRAFKGLVVTDNGVLSVIVPDEAVSIPKSAIEGTFKLAATVHGSGRKLPWTLSRKDAQAIARGVVRVTLGDQPGPTRVTQASDLREPQQPEECCAVQSVASDTGVSSLLESIGRHEIREADGVWVLDLEHADMQAWHGAPVVSLSDGKVIGTMLADARGILIAPFGSARAQD